MVCHFCEDIFMRNREQQLPEQDSIVYEDENIYVMPDISPLAVGHMLIIAKRHYRGYASADMETLHSVEKFLSYYKKKIGNRNYTIFEHGAVIPYTAGASIDHAHIHIVPFELQLGKALNMDFPNGELCQLRQLAAFSQTQQSYLYYKMGNEEFGHAYPVKNISSQYLRDVANHLMKKKVDYNWKQLYKQVDAYLDFYKTLAWWNSFKYPITFKWKKKLILEKYKLTDYRELLEETIRFPIQQYDTVIKLLKKELENNTGNYCRLVLVPVNHKYKLPNYIVETKEDLDGVPQFMKQQEGYNEIWYFSSRKVQREDGCSGRISYTWTAAGMKEIIEVVGSDNPRLLEKYTLQKKDIDYLRLVRQEGDLNYCMEEIQYGVTYKGINEWIACFKQLEKKLDQYKEKLKLFGNMVQKYSIRSFSLEFQMVDGEIIFIDWDTSDDDKILRFENV